MIKILHGADFHLDSPFDALSAEKALTRRKEQRKRLTELADLANKEEVDAVLLAGDLLDGDKSYYETGEALLDMFGQISAPIFIAPGNHDPYHKRSAWGAIRLPEHVHIFSTSVPQAIELRGKNTTVWGMGFTSTRSFGMLNGFSVSQPNRINLMVLHAEIAPEGFYNPITKNQIAQSGLDYLALGHVHQYSGIQKEGNTHYAYPGVLEGRGFDETGPCGVILAEVSKAGVKERFCPLGGRQYHKINLDLSAQEDAYAAIEEALPKGLEQDIVRLCLQGEFDNSLNLELLQERLESRFFHLELRNETTPRQDIWAGFEEDSLRGLFLRKMRLLYEQAGSPAEKERAKLALNYGLRALDQKEEEGS